MTLAVEEYSRMYKIKCPMWYWGPEEKTFYFYLQIWGARLRQKVPKSDLASSKRLIIKEEIFCYMGVCLTPWPFNSLWVMHFN